MSTSKIEVGTGRNTGAQGFQGWSPVLSTVAYLNSIVLKVTDWVNGFGVKPDINVYLTNGGYTTNIALATNVRGSGAVEPGDNVYVTGNFTVKNHSCYLVPAGSFQMLLPGITQVTGLDFKLITQGANLVTLYLSSDQTVYKPSSRSIGTTFEDMNFVVGAAPGTSFVFPKGFFEVRCFFNGTSVAIYIF